MPILTAPGSVLDSADKKEDLVAFLKSLTDERVRYDRAPFDHPQLFVPNGHPEKNNLPATDRTGKAIDSLMEIPAVGRNGLKSPLPNFPCTYQNPNCL